MKDAKNITGLKLAEGSDSPSRKGIYDNGFEKIDEWAGGVAKLSGLGATNWDSGNYQIETGTWDYGTLAGYTQAGRTEFTYKLCEYTRFGNQVRISFHFKGTLNDATGDLVVKNLPFVPKYNSPIVFGYSNINATAGHVQLGSNIASLNKSLSESLETSSLNGVEINIVLDALYTI